MNLCQLEALNISAAFLRLFAREKYDDRNRPDPVGMRGEFPGEPQSQQQREED
jgi:hypothetical protein